MSWVEPPSDPKGLVLYDKFTVGRKLGEGAQSAGIHAVVDSTGRETEHVVKLAKTANPKLAKRKYSEQNINAVLLNGERQRYKAYFKQGSIVPCIPSMYPDGPKVFEGNTNGTCCVSLLTFRWIPFKSFCFLTALVTQGTVT